MKVALADTMDRERSVVTSEWLSLIQNAMTSKVDPIILAQCVSDSGNAKVLSFDARERSTTTDELANLVQFGAHRKKSVCTLGCRFTDGDGSGFSCAESGAPARLARMGAVKEVVEDET